MTPTDDIELADMSLTSEASHVIRISPKEGTVFIPTTVIVSSRADPPGSGKLTWTFEHDKSASLTGDVLEARKAALGIPSHVTGETVNRDAEGMASRMSQAFNDLTEDEQTEEGALMSVVEKENDNQAKGKKWTVAVTKLVRPL